jgi:hypothetical protein
MNTTEQYVPINNPNAIFFLTKAIKRPRPNPTTMAKTGDRLLLF